MRKSLLIIAPHTDDGEFGCGATIAKLVEEGWEAHYVAFSDCKESLPEGVPPDALLKEVAEATRILGITPEHLTTFEFRVRRFSERRQDILEHMVRMKEDIKPDLVLLPSVNDTHQDHQQIAHEGFRAFKTTRMLGYEIPWNNLVFETTCFSIVNERHIKKKIEAMHCYKSQKHRSYATEEFILSLARTRGTQIEQMYAEAFQLFRWII